MASPPRAAPNAKRPFKKHHSGGHRPPQKPAPDRKEPKLGPGGVAEVALVPRGTERWQMGHPWIYRADLNGDPALSGGEVVRVVDHRGWFMGQAFYSKQSKIALRWLAYDDAVVDAAFFAARIARADGLRKRALPGETTYRAVHAESDLLPGLIVDRYGDYLSVQFLSKATDSRKALFTQLLVDQFKPRGIVNRSDVSVRLLEGLEPEKGILHGEVPDTVPFEEGLVRLRADLLNGQKTGAFLDQRENHVVAAQYAQGEALDCFSYAGGFALQLATRAQKVTAIEISESAAALIRSNAEANKFTNIEVSLPTRLISCGMRWTRDASLTPLSWTRRPSRRTRTPWTPRFGATRK